MKTLDDKVVVITGAGSGIGRALALDLARRGARLALSDVDDAGLAETVDLVKDAGATEVRSDQLDVADRAAFTAYAAAVAEHFGRVNVMVNNAGVALAGDFVDLEYADLDWIVGINFWGVVHGTKEFLPHLIASGDGHLVNISSLFGLISMPGQSGYNATKYAVRGMTEALREEMLIAEHPVGVTVVHPGGIKTAIARNARVSAHEDKAADREALRREAGPDDAGAGRRDHRRRVLTNQARVLVGIDAHALHHFAKLTGSRYQDVVARASKRVHARRRWSDVRVTPGTTIHVVMTKWGDLPHWEFDATYLGSDVHGDWLGIPAGTTMTRPGVDYVAPVAQVGLVPGPEPAVERGWLATFHDEGGPVRVYVDMTTPPEWDQATVRRSTWTWTSSRTRTVECGSTTRTSSPSTGSSSATPTRWWGSRPPPATGSATWWPGVRRRSTAGPGDGSPSCPVSPPDPRPPSRASAAGGGCAPAGRARAPARSAAVRRAGTRPAGPRA